MGLNCIEIRAENMLRESTCWAHSITKKESRMKSFACDSTTTGKEIFLAVKGYMKEDVSHE
jgi:hypothetical protein